MKIVLIFLGAFILSIGCKNKNKTEIPAAQTTTDTVANFFPVTSYIKGQIIGIKEGGITPLRKITVNNHMDSSWVKPEQYDSVFAEFLSPVIDTANLKTTFIEKKFLDQTLNAFTFTYDNIPGKETDFPFRHWDVYVDPDKGEIKRVYLLKKKSSDTDLQLTWKSGKWCKIITLQTFGDKTKITKEEKISWSYDTQ